MKKLLALLLAMVMIVGMMAGCGKKDEKTNSTESGNNAANQQAGNNEETGAPTEPKSHQIFGVAVGTELEAPEKVFSTEGVKTFYISFDRKVSGKLENTEISLVEAEDGTCLIFAVNGPGKNKEAIYEITDAGVTKYIKGSGKNPYKLDEKTTAEEVLKESVTLAAYLQIFTQYQTTFTGIKYRKAANVSANCPTGDVYVYDVVSGGKVVGQVCIDKETGLLVKAKDLSNGKVAGQFCIDENGQLVKAEKEAQITNTVVAVQAFKTADVQIPEYAKTEAPAEGETPDAEPQA